MYLLLLALTLKTGLASNDSMETKHVLNSTQGSKASRNYFSDSQDSSRQRRKISENRSNNISEENESSRETPINELINLDSLEIVTPDNWRMEVFVDSIRREAEQNDKLPVSKPVRTKRINVTLADQNLQPNKKKYIKLTLLNRVDVINPQVTTSKKKQKPWDFKNNRGSEAELITPQKKLWENFIHYSDYSKITFTYTSPSAQ